MSSYEDAVIRVGNKGTTVDITMYSVTGSTQTAVNLGNPAGSTFQIEFKRKDNSTQLVTAAIKNSPGTDGVITYVDTDGSVFQNAKATKGRWTVRGVITYASGNTFKGSWQGFTVGE